MRTLVIGDIHGGLKALQQCLDRAKVTPQDNLIFLGDYVDGWSESAETIKFLINLSKNMTCTFLRGNHDVWCEDWLTMGVTPLNWTQNGGQSTIDSYIKSGLLMSEEHRKFFRGLHNYMIDDKNRGFVHGGFISRKGLGHEAYQSDYYWDRDLWELAMICDGRNKEDISDKAGRFFKHSEVFIGHTSVGNYNVKPRYPEYKDVNQKPNGSITVPMKRCNVWNIDTGGGFEGKLTIMDIDTKQYWQSDYVKDLYPDDRGRN